MFTWVNFTLTDSAFHEGGPYSEMAASPCATATPGWGGSWTMVEQAGVWEETAFFLVADHGMEESTRAFEGIGTLHSQRQTWRYATRATASYTWAVRDPVADSSYFSM